MFNTLNIIFPTHRKEIAIDEQKADGTIFQPARESVILSLSGSSASLWVIRLFTVTSYQASTASNCSILELPDSV